MLTAKRLVTPAKAGAHSRTGSRPPPGRQEGGASRAVPGTPGALFRSAMNRAAQLSDPWSATDPNHAGLQRL